MDNVSFEGELRRLRDYVKGDQNFTFYFSVGLTLSGAVVLAVAGWLRNIPLTVVGGLATLVGVYILCAKFGSREGYLVGYHDGFRGKEANDEAPDKSDSRESSSQSPWSRLRRR